MRLGNQSVENAHGACTDNDDGLAVLDAKAAEAGAAGAQRLKKGGHGRIDALIDLVAGNFLGNGVVGAAGVAKIAIRVGVIGALQLGALTGAALAAGLRIGVVLVTARDVVAYGNAVDRRADLDHGTCPLVSKHQGKRTLARAVKGTVFGRADVICINLDQNVVLAQLGKLAIDHLCRLNRSEYSCFCFHGFLVFSRWLLVITAVGYSAARKAMSACCLAIRSSSIHSSSPSEQISRA